ncbi:MAG: transposase [Bryobacterales bacterium]|nr:transposase [Bryobacterales bacterium]
MPAPINVIMVAHCGKSVAGSHLHSLVLTDIGSAWTVAAPMLVREQTLVTMTVEDIRSQLPFPLLGLDVDNDAAFINATLVDYCRDRGIELTRSRAYKKNDQAWIEQKNGSVVRRMVGYGRLEGLEALEALAELHRAARLYVNFFLPSFKLQSKIRNGAKLSRKYDTPTTTCERLLASERVTAEHRERLRQTFATLDPIELLRRIREAQNRLSCLEVCGASGPPAPTDTGVDQFVRSLGTVWKKGEIRATHRKRAVAPRSWRTREDPFESVWTTIQQWLNEKPEATAKELFQRLQQQRPESFPAGQLRTLQRRVKEWRTAIARRLVLGAGSEAALMPSIRAEATSLAEETSLIEMGASPQTPRI